MSKPRQRVVFLDAATFGDLTLGELHRNLGVHRASGHFPCADNLAPGRTRQSPSPTKWVSMSRYSKRHLSRRPHKLIAVAATGTDVIDKAAAAPPGGSLKQRARLCQAWSVAQFTAALMLVSLPPAPAITAPLSKPASGRKVRSIRSPHYPQVELSGEKTRHHRLRQYWPSGGADCPRPRHGDPHRRSPGRIRHRSPQTGFTLEQIFRAADVITLHCPLTPQTKNLVNAANPGADATDKHFSLTRLAARSSTKPALIETLRQKRIAGAALDVITQEPPPADHPMIVAAQKNTEFALTPAHGPSAREARQRLLFEVKENILAFTQGSERNRIA